MDFNCIAQGVLSVPDDADYQLNIFTFNEDLTVNQEQLQNDIDTYGLYTTEGSDYLSKEEYDRYGLSDEEFEMLQLKYINLMIGKGLITKEVLFAAYDEIFEENETESISSDLELLNSVSTTSDDSSDYHIVIGSNVIIKDNYVKETPVNNISNQYESNVGINYNKVGNNTITDNIIRLVTGIKSSDVGVYINNISNDELYKINGIILGEISDDTTTLSCLHSDKWDYGLILNGKEITVVKRQVQYNPNGGVWAEDYEAPRLSADPAPTKDNISRTGYTFDGWELVPKDSTNSELNKIVIWDTYRAKWTLDKSSEIPKGQTTYMSKDTLSKLDDESPCYQVSNSFYKANIGGNGWNIIGREVIHDKDTLVMLADNNTGVYAWEYKHKKSRVHPKSLLVSDSLLYAYMNENLELECNVHNLLEDFTKYIVQYSNDNNEADYLYLPGAGKEFDTSIGIGRNNQFLLPISVFYNNCNYDRNYGIWLRPYEEITWDDASEWYGTYCMTGGNVDFTTIDGRNNVFPVFNLDLSSILFASTAIESSESAYFTDSFVFRMNGDQKIDSCVDILSNTIRITDSNSEEIYLYIQGSDTTKDWVYSEKIYHSEIFQFTDIINYLKTKGIDTSNITIDKCNIWIEKTDNKVTYAKIADKSNGQYHYLTSATMLDSKKHLGKCSLNCGTLVDEYHLFYKNGVIDTDMEKCSVCNAKNIAYKGVCVDVNHDSLDDTITKMIVVKDEKGNIISSDNYIIEELYGSMEGSVKITGKGSYAGERIVSLQSPSIDSFISKEVFNRSDFNNIINTKNGKKIYVYFGIDRIGSRYPLYWNIAGTNTDKTLALIYNNVENSSLRTEVFKSVDDKKFDLGYGLYDSTTPDKVHGNHYGNSAIRQKLYEIYINCFNSDEQNLIAESTIYNEDVANETVYLLKDKLYAPYGTTRANVKVGNNTKEALDSGISVTLDSSINGIYLRNPTSYGCVHVIYDNQIFICDYTDGLNYIALPACNIKTDSLLFMSKMLLPNSHYDRSFKEIQIEYKDAYFMRFDGRGIIESNAALNKNNDEIIITKAGADEYLCVQWSEDGVDKSYCSEVSVGSISAEKILGSGKKFLPDCKIWIEKEVNQVSYAKYVEKTAIAIEEASLTLAKGTIGINFYFTNMDLFQGGYIDIDGTKYNINGPTQGDEYVYTKYVNAKNMSDKIAIKLYDKNNKFVELANSNDKDGVFYYSVMDYLSSIKDSSDMINLSKAISNYGLCSQYYFRYKAPEALPTVDSVDDYEAHKAITTGTLPDGVEYIGSSLLLKSNTTIRHYFYMNNAGNITFKVDGVTTGVKKDKNIYYLDITGINALNLSNKYKVTVSDGKKTFELQYSALSYCEKVNSSVKDSSLLALTNSLYWYNKETLDYFASK